MQSFSSTTQTTKDAYRIAVIEHKQFLYKFYSETGNCPFNQLPQMLLTFHGLVKGMENWLIGYIREKGLTEANKEYQERYNKIEFDFDSLLNDDANEETYRRFSGACLEWIGLLTLYFSDVGILPKSRTMEYLGDTGLNKIHTMEDAIKFIKDGIKHLDKVDYLTNDYTGIPEKLDLLEVNYAQLPPGHSTAEK